MRSSCSSLRPRTSAPNAASAVCWATAASDPAPVTGSPRAERGCRHRRGRARLRLRRNHVGRRRPARGGSRRATARSHAAASRSRFASSASLGAFGEPRQDLAGEQLDRLADVLVAVLAGLDHEDHLVDAGGLVALDELGDLVGRADRAAQRAEPLLQQLHAERRLSGVDDRAREAELVAVRLELVPDVGAARAVLAEDVVVGERVAEEVARRRCPRSIASASSSWHIIGSTTAKLRVDREAARHALLRGDERRSTRRPTPSPPRARRTRTTARRCPCARPAGSSRGASTRPTAAGAAAASPWARRCAAASAGALPSTPANGSSTNIRVTASSASSHCSRLVGALHAEAPELGLRGRLAGAEVDPAVGDQVERRDALGDPRRVVEAGGSWTIPWPRRMRFVRCEQAARNTSGAQECEYSSRKWCSTSQT